MNLSQILELAEAKRISMDGGNPQWMPIPYLQGIYLVVKPGAKKIGVDIGQKRSNQKGPDWNRQAGPFAKFLRQGRYEVNPYLLRSKTMKLMERVFVFEDLDKDLNPRDAQTLTAIKVRKTDLDGTPRKQEYIEAETFAKILAFCTSSQLQNKLIDRLKTLEHPLFGYYASGWEASRLRIHDLDVLRLPFQFSNAANPDHLGKGLIPMKVNVDSQLELPIYRQDRENQVVHSDGGTKKAMSRQKLSYCVDGAEVGYREVLVLSKLDPLLVRFFSTGGVYAPGKFVSQYGPCRITAGKALVKGVTLPKPSVMSHLGDCFVMAKSSFKGGMRSVIQFGGVREEVSIMGKKCVGFRFKVPMVITNLYQAYGYALSEQVKKDPSLLLSISVNGKYEGFMNSLYDSLLLATEVDNEENDLPHSVVPSVYLYMLEQINLDQEFSVTDFLMDMLKSNVVEKSDIRTEMKAFDVMNVYRSYGYKVAESFVKAVMLEQKDVNELHERLKGKLVLDEVSDDVVYGIAGSLFKAGKIVTDLNVEKLDGDRPERRAVVQKQIGAYIDGTANWDGLRGKKAKSITIQGLEFYIPGGKVMSKFIFPEKDLGGKETGRYFMSGPAMLANELFQLVSQYGDKDEIPYEHLQLFYMYYYATLQVKLNGLYGENHKVVGFGNKVIVPNWINDKLMCTDSEFKLWHKTTALFSKMPVLFNKAIHGIEYSCDVEDLYGQLSEKERFALSACVFVPVDVLLAHQNDCDGDLARVMFMENHGVPLFDGSQLPKWMKEWHEKYKEGECDLDMNEQVKPMVTEHFSVIDAVLRESVLSKRTIGRGSNFANILNAIGMSLFPKDFGPTGDAMYMMLQEVIAGVKHDRSKVILDYLSNKSFNQTFGAKEITWKGDINDMSFCEIADLSCHVDRQVGHEVKESSFNILTQIGQVYTMPKVSGMMFDRRMPIVKRDTMFKMLGMYIYAINEKPYVGMRNPDYKKFSEDFHSYDQRIYGRLLKQFEEVNGSLVFASGIEKPKKIGLTHLWYKLLG